MRVDVEWLALRAGLKPAIRLTAEPSEVEALEARFSRLGAKVARGLWRRGQGRVLAVLYVARSARDAEALRDVEAPVIDHETPTPRQLEVNACMEVGRRLGYPRCCVEAFCARVERGCGVLSSGSIVASEDYVAARDAWVARPCPRLNTLLLAASIRWITFEPCRFDCSLARSLADAVAGLVASRSPESASAIDRVLAMSVVITAEDARAQVAVDRALPCPRIQQAWAQRTSEGRPIGPRDDELAARLPGLTVNRDGAVAGSGAPPALFVDFGAPR